MKPTSVTAVFGIAIAIVLLSGGVNPARATDWAGAELAWRNDPRPAADEAFAVEPPQPRRPTRRAQRRSLRRIEPDAVVLEPNAVPHVEPPTVREPLVTPPEARRLAAAPPGLVHRDQHYGDHPRQRYDLYLPDGCAGGGLPVVVWIHGPDWRTGSKADCPVAWLVEQGFAVASIDYRPSDAAVFPAQVDDCRAAVEAIRAEADTWGLDAARICVAGLGGGGHLAALVGFARPDASPIHPASTEVVDGDVAAVAIFDAPVHLPSLGGQHDRGGSAASRLVGGPLPEVREAAQRASPLVHVSADDPPTLIVQGGRGDGVAVDQGTRLDAALRAAGVSSGLVVLDAAAADLAPRQGTPSAGALVEFLDRAVGTADGRVEH